MTNSALDSALFDSEAMPVFLVHKISTSLPKSTQFAALPSPSAEQKTTSPCPCCQCWHFLNNVLSGSISVNSTKRWDINKVIIYYPPPGFPNSPPTT
ncbi:unnamed protein product [Hymenolepis diminuta]|uniref:Uncharacterized protein n=1 Tax=Hymenolepis diminuta TaxID=6216 RepID=A0A564YWA1_HYMDI|nr:unnamed protein product [Hymenolepis diminuta]